MSEAEELQKFIGEEVIIDTKSSMVYIGLLKKVTDYFIEIDEVDVHDMNSSTSNKEIYAMESKKFGIKKNRANVNIFMREVISISKLEDVFVF